MPTLLLLPLLLLPLLLHPFLLLIVLLLNLHILLTLIIFFLLFLLCLIYFKRESFFSYFYSFNSRNPSHPFLVILFIALLSPYLYPPTLSSSIPPSYILFQLILLCYSIYSSSTSHSICSSSATSRLKYIQTTAMIL